MSAQYKIIPAAQNGRFDVMKRIKLLWLIPIWVYVDVGVRSYRAAEFAIEYDKQTDQHRKRQPVFFD